MICSCCNKPLGGDLYTAYVTHDGRMWRHEHGEMALKMEREAIRHGTETFTMPTIRLLQARAHVKKNNQKRFGR